MKLHYYTRVLLYTILLTTIVTSCTQVPDNPIFLASFNESSVNVSVFLERDPIGHVFLSATFTPSHGYHLYGKDLPLTGINGLGRPTRLELTPNSQTRVLGDLIESVVPQVTREGSSDLLVYPAGPVTLRLPIQLRAGDDWAKDEIKISFMACSDNLCKPPVEKNIAIRLPGADLFNNSSSLKGD